MEILKNTRYASVYGFNYHPSYGSCGFEIWNDFKPNIIEKEITLGKKYFPGINTLRIWLSWDAFLRDRNSFKTNFKIFLKIIKENGLKTIVVLFNAWQGFPYFGGVSLGHIKLWKYKPSIYKTYFDNYVKEIIFNFADDVFLWDLCNEPSTIYTTDTDRKLVFEWLESIYKLTRNTKILVTIGNIPNLEEIKFYEKISDVITFHPYFAINAWIKNLEQFTGFLDETVKFANKVNKPFLASETGWGSLDDFKRVKYLEIELENLKKRKIGFIAHLLYHTLVADGHRPEYGPISEAGYMAFIERDGSLRIGHEVFNKFCRKKDYFEGKINFFEEYTKKVIERCKVIKEINDQIYTLYVPSGDMKYPSFWIRDAFYIFDTGFVDCSEIKTSIELIAKRQNIKEKNLKNGLIVPSYAIPDHINFDGGSVFFPGTYSSGEEQGKGKFGFYPPHDNQYFFIEIAYLYYTKTKDIEFFKKEIDGISLIERLEKAFESYNIDKKTDLPYSDFEKHTVDWGFCDTVKKSGLLLFPSLLRYKSAHIMKEIEGKLGEKQKEKEYLERARIIKNNIIESFYDEKTGWFLSSTKCGRQYDVAGTLYAIYLDILDRTRLEKTYQIILKGYKDGSCVDKDGYVRSIPIYGDFSKETMWEKCLCKKEIYQNGGYWAFLTGWYIFALSKIDKKECKNLIENFFDPILKDRNKGAPYEWKNDKINQFSGSFYGASVSIPYKMIGVVLKCL